MKQNTISRYERGEHIPVREHLERLLAVTGLPTDALVRPERFLAEHPEFLAEHAILERSPRGRPSKA
jgi:transcriptional regulator with XRE-family HTH domain